MDKALQASDMPSGVRDFLLQPDCSGSISKSVCVELYQKIHNYDNNIIYGFHFVRDKMSGSWQRQNLGFQDFVELIKECIDTDSELFWS